MATNNATDTSKPVAISQGGTNASSMTNTDGVIYYDGSKLSSTGVGTAGQVLTSNGPGVAPSFQAGGGGMGGITFLATYTANNSTSIDITSVISGTYNSYQIYYSAVVPVSASASLYLLNSTDNGVSWKTANGSYRAGLNYAVQGAGSFTNVYDPLGRFMPLTAPMATTAGAGASGYVNIYNTSNGAYFAMSGLNVFNGSTSGGATMGWYGDAVDPVGPNGQIGVNAIRFIMSSGNIASGTFSIYGVAE